MNDCLHRRSRFIRTRIPTFGGSLYSHISLCHNKPTLVQLILPLKMYFCLWINSTHPYNITPIENILTWKIFEQILQEFPNHFWQETHFRAGPGICKIWFIKKKLLENSRYLLTLTIFSSYLSVLTIIYNFGNLLKIIYLPLTITMDSLHLVISNNMAFGRFIASSFGHHKLILHKDPYYFI